MTEPRLDPPDSPELFFQCDECDEVISDEEYNIKNGDVCPICAPKNYCGFMRPYEQPERDWEDCDDN